MNQHEPGRNVYIGHRYVPLLIGEWDKSIGYEGLSIVTYKGASYTSKKRVPVGIEIDNEEFWVLTGNYNAQIEYYREDVNRYRDEVYDFKEEADRKISDVRTYVDDQTQETRDYVDGQTSETRQYVDNEVSSARQYVDDEVSSTRQYVDDEVLSARQYVDDETQSTRDFVNDEITGVNQSLNNVSNKLDDVYDPTQSNVNTNPARSAFNDAMNKKAEILGMDNTGFSNPHGLYDTGNYTTARDMVLMGLNALSYPEIIQAWGRHNYTARVEGANARNVNISRTIMASSIDDDFIMGGGKTGTLSAHDTQNILSIIKSKITNDWLLMFVGTSGSSRYTSTRQAGNHGITALKNNKPVEHHVSNLSNGDFNAGLEYWTRNAGNPELTKKTFHSHPQSLKCWGASSQQVSRGLTLNSGDIYYVRGYVKCDRHNTGSLGITFSSSSGYSDASVSRQTEGWELVSSRFTASGSTTMFAGSFDGADLDGYIDSMDFINLTSEYGSGNEPSKTEMDNIYTGNIGGSWAYVVDLPDIANGYNVDNLQPLFAKNPDEQIHPASVAKVMTAMIVLDNYDDLSMKIEVESSDTSGGSGSDVNAGDIITLNDALHMLLMESNNTIARTLERVTGKKIEIDKRHRTI